MNKYCYDVPSLCKVGEKQNHEDIKQFIFSTGPLESFWSNGDEVMEELHPGHTHTSDQLGPDPHSSPAQISLHWDNILCIQLQSWTHSWDSHLIFKILGIYMLFMHSVELESDPCWA